MEAWFRLIKSGENSLPNAFFADEEELFGNVCENLDQGHILANWNPESSMRSNTPRNDGDTNDVVFAGIPMIPTFSPRLQRALADDGIGTQDFQYLPVRLIRSTGDEINGFAIVNVVTRVSALDRERCFMLSADESEIDPVTGMADIHAIGKIAVRHEPLQEHDVVRLVEFRRAVLVSQRFADVFRKGKFTGASCSPLIMT